MNAIIFLTQFTSEKVWPETIISLIVKQNFEDLKS